MSNPSVLSHSVARPVLLIIGILLIATTLRAPISGIAPLLDTIKHSFTLSTTNVSMLITLPLLAFAFISPFAARISREYGIERTLFIALCVTAIGIAVRSTGSEWNLYLGTLVIGSGIAIINVLLPSLIKRDFPAKVTILTAFYALSMGAMAALSSAIVVPLSQASHFGWRFATGIFILLPIISAIVWLPQLRSHTVMAQNALHSADSNKVWHSALAWQVTLFFGINSFINYVAISWLPDILQDAGYTAAQAGSLHGLLQLSGALPVLFVIPFIARLKDQRVPAFLSTLVTIAGLLGLLFAPTAATLWVILLGIGTGMSMVLSLSFVGLRSTNAHQAAALSGMVQCVGYLLSAAGPPLMGKLHEISHNWHLSLGLCVAFCVVMAIVGWLAGRARRISDVP